MRFLLSGSIPVLMLLFVLISIHTHATDNTFEGTIHQTRSWLGSPMSDDRTLIVSDHAIRWEVEEGFSKHRQGVIVNLKTQTATLYWIDDNQRQRYDFNLDDYDQWLEDLRNRKYASNSTPLDSQFINVERDKLDFVTSTNQDSFNAGDACTLWKWDDGHVYFEVEQCDQYQLPTELLDRISLRPDFIDFYPSKVKRLTGTRRERAVGEHIQVGNDTPQQEGDDSMVKKLFRFADKLFRTATQLTDYKITTDDVTTQQPGPEQFRLEGAFTNLPRGDARRRLFQRERGRP